MQQKFFQSGNAFFSTAILFLIVSALTGKAAIYLSLAVVFFVLGMVARKRSLERASEEKPKEQAPTAPS